MRCHELRAFGLANLLPAERLVPEIGPCDVLIRVQAVSINYRDWLMIQGKYNPRQPLPLIPLSDGAGEIVTVGKSVSRVKTGDRVMVSFFPEWIAGPPASEVLRRAMGGPLDGMLSEYRVIHERSVVLIPPHLTALEAATLPCAAVTAWNALIEQGRIQPGDTVVVQGTGGVSLFALQFARMAGARVIVTSSSLEKLAKAQKLGADDTIHYSAIPEWDRRVKELTGGRGADHIVEVGGAGTIAKSLRAVRPGGAISIIGVLSGNSTETSLIPILMQNIRLQGISVGSRETFEHMTRAIVQNKLHPVIDQVFALTELHQAFEHLAAGAHFGKIVIRLD